MTISKRKLNNWRKEALIEVDNLKGGVLIKFNTEIRRGQAEKILKLTQELIDQQLIKEHKEKQNVS